MIRRLRRRLARLVRREPVRATFIATGVLTAVCGRLGLDAMTLVPLLLAMFGLGEFARSQVTPSHEPSHE